MEIKELFCLKNGTSIIVVEKVQFLNYPQTHNWGIYVDGNLYKKLPDLRIHNLLKSQDNNDLIPLETTLSFNEIKDKLNINGHKLLLVPIE